MTRRRLSFLLVAMLSGCGGGFRKFDTLPDAKIPFSDSRKNNTVDEYSKLVAEYGNPDSIFSTESKSPRPKVPIRIVRYKAAHLKVTFTPNGCVAAYEKVYRDSSKYLSLAQDELRRLEPCKPNQGWSIVDYVDLTDDMPISARLASASLDNQGSKRLADPLVMNTGDITDTPLELRQQTEADMQRRRDAKTYDDAATVRQGCKIIYNSTIEKKVNDLTVREIPQINACQALGLYSQ